MKKLITIFASFALVCIGTEAVADSFYCLAISGSVTYMTKTAKFSLPQIIVQAPNLDAAFDICGDRAVAGAVPACASVGARDNPEGIIRGQLIYNGQRLGMYNSVCGSNEIIYGLKGFSRKKEL